MVGAAINLCWNVEEEGEFEFSILFQTYFGRDWELLTVGSGEHTSFHEVTSAHEQNRSSRDLRQNRNYRILNRAIAKIIGTFGYRMVEACMALQVAHGDNRNNTLVLF